MQNLTPGPADPTERLKQLTPREIVSQLDTKVIDLSSGQETPSQIIQLGGSQFVRFEAPDVPPVGYKVFEIRREPGGAPR